MNYSTQGFSPSGSAGGSASTIKLTGQPHLAIAVRAPGSTRGRSGGGGEDADGAGNEPAAARHPSLDAWAETRRLLPNLGSYCERKNGMDEDLPTFCIKASLGTCGLSWRRRATNIIG